MTEPTTDRLPAALAAMRDSAPDIDSRWQHRKGGTYVVLATALLESDLTPVVVYQNVNQAVVWVRPLAEFTDGRFTRLCP